MGLLDINTNLGELITSVGGFAKSIRTAITGKEPIDANKAAEIALQAQELDARVFELSNQINLAQMEINKVEAQSQRIWVAGWRPFIGWVGGSALAYAAIIEPFISWAARLYGYTGVFPVIDTTITMQVLFGILGLGAFRTVDKIKAGSK